jgi:ActR/RegA family two-component response regulator
LRQKGARNDEERPGGKLQKFPGLRNILRKCHFAHGPFRFGENVYFASLGRPRSNRPSREGNEVTMNNHVETFTKEGHIFFLAPAAYFDKAQDYAWALGTATGQPEKYRPDNMWACRVMAPEGKRSGGLWIDPAQAYASKAKALAGAQMKHLGRVYPALKHAGAIRILIASKNAGTIVRELSDLEYKDARATIEATRDLDFGDSRSPLPDALIIDEKMIDIKDGIIIAGRFSAMRVVVIVLSVNPAIHSCVEYVKAGACDYLNLSAIAKGELNRAIIAGIDSRMKPADSCADFLKDNHDELAAKHGGEYIAVIGNRVAGHNRSESDLRREIAEIYPFFPEPWITRMPVEPTLEGLEAVCDAWLEG